jgi:ComF family protein
VAGRYEGALKLAIHSYKFLYKRAASEDLTTLLDSLLPPTRSDLIVVSVPTVTSRVRRRGFDHAMLLAKSLVHKRKLVYINVLSRTGQKQQVGLGRNDRLIAQKDTMYIRNGDIVVGKNILLVDDVVTTGSTLNEAARVLKSAGAARVDCVVLAQSALE